MNALRIEPIAPAQLNAVASLHCRAFTESTITAFGPEAVRRYYAWLLEGPHDADLVGAWRRERLLGFCAAGTFNGALSGFLRTNRLYLAFRFVTHPWLVASPLVRDRIKQGAQVLQRSSRRGVQAPVGVRRFGVLAIATDVDARGQGVGQALMANAELRARGRGFDRMGLSVHPDNVGAIRFYEGLGWTRREAGDDAWNGAMEKRLS